MADIILAGDNFSLKKLRSAVEQLEDAQNLMQKVYDAVFSTSFWAEANPFALLDGSKNMNVFDGTIDELHTYQQRVHQKEETLRTLAQRIEAAVRELAETDQSFRGKLSGESEKNTWERITGAVSSVRQIVSAAALSLIGAINGLFSSDGTVTGEVFVDPHEKIKPITQDEIDKQNLYIKYENDKYIDKTELKMVVETSKNAEETEMRIGNIRAPKQKSEMRDRYISQTVPNADYWGEYYYDSKYYKDIVNYGCFASSISMAISSLGINCLPMDVCRINQAKLEPWNPMLCAYEAVGNNYGLKLTSPGSLDSALRNYLENPDVYTPPIIRTTGSGGSPWHYVVIIGKLEDGSLVARDPASGDKIIRAYEIHQIIQYVG